RLAAHLLAGSARRRRAASPGPCHAAAVLRNVGGRERPRGAGSPRARAARPGGRLAVAAAAPAPRGGRGRGGGAQRGSPVTAGGGRAERRSRLVGLPRLELVRRGQGPNLRLEPLLRAAQLVARR